MRPPPRCAAAEKRAEFARLQGLLRELLAADFPWLEGDEATLVLLRQPWSKAVEDQTDALFCALIGLWHLHHRGRRSEVIGDLTTGFILLPKAQSLWHLDSSQK